MIALDQSGAIMKDQSRFVVTWPIFGATMGARTGSSAPVLCSQTATRRPPSCRPRCAGCPLHLPTSGPVKFELVGDLTLQQTTKPVVWQVEGQIENQDFKGTASTSFKFADFGLSQPRVAAVLSVEDNIRLEMDFTCRLLSLDLSPPPRYYGRARASPECGPWTRVCAVLSEPGDGIFARVPRFRRPILSPRRGNSRHTA